MVEHVRAVDEACGAVGTAPVLPPYQHRLKPWWQRATLAMREFVRPGQVVSPGWRQPRSEPVAALKALDWRAAVSRRIGAFLLLASDASSALSRLCPKPLRDRHRIDAEVVPPGRFVARGMETAMVATA